MRSLDYMLAANLGWGMGLLLSGSPVGLLNLATVVFLWARKGGLAK